jgi:hypothetical protein
MIELKYKSWDDITIPVYQEIIDIAKGSEVDEELFSQREIDILAVLCDSDSESLGNILIEDYTKLAREAQYLHKMPFYTVPSTITLRGVEYKVVVDMSKFTLAQYTEYNALRADASTKISNLVACLLIPATAKHYADGYDVSEVVQAIETELPYYKAYGILNFFHAAQSLSLASTLCSKGPQLRKMARRTKSKEERERLEGQVDQLRKAYTSLGRCLLNR